MTTASKLIIAFGLAILIAIFWSHSRLTSQIEQGVGNISETASNNAVTIYGTGDTITQTIGGTPACTGGAQKIKVITTIEDGSAGNKIEGTAKCSLSNWSATVESTDPGNGSAASDHSEATPGQGQGYCSTKYTSSGAAATDSNWAVSCTF